MEAHLSDLIAKLEAASEGSRELDALVWVAATGSTFSHLAENAHLDRVTTSLDAIVALIERKLPGRAWMLSSPDKLLSHPLCQGEVAEGEFSFETTKGCAPTPALALCIAFLRALQAQQETSEDE